MKKYLYLTLAAPLFYFPCLAMAQGAAALTTAEATSLDDYGMLPKQRVAVRLQPSWRNPFAEKPKETAAASGQTDADTMDTKLRAFFNSQKITGLTTINGKRAALAGKVQLVEGELVEPIFEDQTESMRVALISDKLVKLEWVEDKGSDSTKARDIILVINKKALVKSQLVGANGDGRGPMVARLPKRDASSLARDIQNMPVMAVSESNSQSTTDLATVPVTGIGRLPDHAASVGAVAGGLPSSGSGAVPAPPAMPIMPPTAATTQVSASPGISVPVPPSQAPTTQSVIPPATAATNSIPAPSPTVSTPPTQASPPAITTPTIPVPVPQPTAEAPVPSPIVPAPPVVPASAPMPDQSRPVVPPPASPSKVIE